MRGRLVGGALAIAVTALLPLSSTISRAAEGVLDCDDAKIADKLPKPPDGCQREKISASGREGIGFTMARNRAEQAWQDQVRNKFGERFMQWAKAACPKSECDPGGMGMIGKHLIRCTYTAYPCANLPKFPEATEDMVKEVQKLLVAKGYDVPVDGKFGEKTRRALRKFQKKNGLDDDGVADAKTMELLRKS